MFGKSYDRILARFLYNIFGAIRMAWKNYIPNFFLFRSSHPEVFLRKGALKICSKFTEDYPWRSVISIKLLFLRTPLHGCFCLLFETRDRGVKPEKLCVLLHSILSLICIGWYYRKQYISKVFPKKLFPLILCKITLAEFLF